MKKSTIKQMQWDIIITQIYKLIKFQYEIALKDLICSWTN